MIVIEHYYKQGVLHKDVGRWSAEDRLRVAMAFYKHYRQAGMDMKAVDPSKIRVDSSLKMTNEISLYAEDRFRKTLRAIPQEYSNVVVDVVIVGNIIKGCYKKREKEKQKLRLGLDALCDFYRKVRE